MLLCSHITDLHKMHNDTHMHFIIKSYNINHEVKFFRKGHQSQDFSTNFVSSKTQFFNELCFMTNKNNTKIK